MTQAEMLKTQMKKSWGKFSDDELYRVFCLLIEQIEALEKQNKSLKKEATQFYLSRIATLLLDMSLMFILVSVCHFNDKIMKILVQIIVVLGNYIISKLIVFKKN